MSPAAQRRPEHGIALIAVLSILVLLSILALSLMNTTRTEVRVAANLRDNAVAQALAEAGVNRGILGLLHPDPQQQWAADGRPYGFSFAGGEVVVAIQDEGGKVDLNHASGELLRALFVSTEPTRPLAGRLVDLIGDWVDPDNLRRFEGGEDADYRALGLSYGAKDAPFETIEELQQLPGVSAELFAAVAPAVTVDSGQRGVDLATAPPQVLAALPGFDPETLEAFLRDRAAGSAAAGTLPPLPPDLGPYLASSRRTTFTIRAEARAPSGAVFVREAVVRLTGVARQPFRVLAWRQGRLSPPVAASR